MTRDEEVQQAFRPPDPRELGILSKLLEVDFAGAAEIKRQLGSLLVRQLADDGTLSLRVVAGVPVPIKWKTPAEGRYIDSDGVGVSIILHVDDDGLLSMMEVIKDDQSPIQTEPTADEIVVF